MPIDPRILRVGVEVSGKINYYEDLNIVVGCTKFANAIENECTVKIQNLSKQVRDYILSETSPFNKSKTPKRLIVEAGRESTGSSVVFVGDIISASPSQPPDIALTIKAQTKNTSKGDIVTKSQDAQASMRTIASGIASDLDLSLIFEAMNKNISNFNFTGGVLKQVEKLAESGLVNVFVDDDKMVVKDKGVPLKSQAQVISAESGMIGLPSISAQGVKVKYLFSNLSVIGGSLIVDSKINTAANGTYEIYKMTYELASRDNPFYITAEAKRL